MTMSMPYLLFSYRTPVISDSGSANEIAWLR